MNVLIGAVSGMGGTAITKEALSVAAEKIREITIESSALFPGVTDGVTTLTNLSGISEGIRGDLTKTGGTRSDLDLLCGTDNSRCKTNIDGSLQVDNKGQVQFEPEKAGVKSLVEFIETDEGKKLRGLTGGIQGWKGTLFGQPYPPGSWQDKLVESFGGTHDVVGGQLSGLYDDQGNIKRGRSKLEINMQNTWSATGAIALSTPFAMSELLPPQVWNAIATLLKEAR